MQNTIDFKLSGKLALLFCLEKNGFDSDKTVALKSGNFGDRNFFATAVAKLEA
ncbi:hypothetical protein OAT72_05810 [Alphaproteobacteria bacterium]|nr:hypothetical protein [Alphaproteobacteria bacterium]